LKDVLNGFGGGLKARQIQFMTQGIQFFILRLQLTITKEGSVNLLRLVLRGLVV
jgi:hypothetical protein